MTVLASERSDRGYGQIITNHQPGPEHGTLTRVSAMTGCQDDAYDEQEIPTI